MQTLATGPPAEPSDVISSNPARVQGYSQLQAWPWVQWEDFFSPFLSEPNPAVKCWDLSLEQDQMEQKL